MELSYQQVNPFLSCIIVGYLTTSLNMEEKPLIFQPENRSINAKQSSEKQKELSILERRTVFLNAPSIKTSSLEGQQLAQGAEMEGPPGQSSSFC